MENIKKKDLGKVKYIGAQHSVLVTGNIYEIFSKSDKGVQVYIKTGYAGIPNKSFEVVT